MAITGESLELLKVGFLSGSGAPTSVHVAPKGSFYINTAAGSSFTRAYVNTTGGSVWTAFVTIA